MTRKKVADLFSMFLLAAVIAGRSNGFAEDNDRSKKESALIIAGSTAAGALLGSAIGGGKGAAAGAVAGAGGAVIYDSATRGRGHESERSRGERAVLIGGSTATGAAAGGIAGGRKGALIGAMIGAAGGYILDKSSSKDRRIF